MERLEIKNFIGKIKAYYPYFDTSNKNVYEEWAEKLAPYKKEDIIKKFENYVISEKRREIPQLYDLTKGLLTEEEQKVSINDYLISCDLCGKWMKLSTYENIHRNKCLTAKTLEKLIQDENATYEELIKYDEDTLDKLWEKYKPSNLKVENLYE